MKRFVKRCVRRVLPEQYLKYRAYRVLIGDKTSYLYRCGWMKSLEIRRPAGEQSEVIPNMNYPMIAFLDERLQGEFALFEYGSGYSTKFFASRVKQLVSVDFDSDSLDKKSQDFPPNVQLRMQEGKADYSTQISADGARYDLVVVDGKFRVNCIKQGLRVLTEGGVIILCDSHRPRYAEGIQFAQEQGFKALHFSGLKVYGAGLERATVLYKEGNCLGI